MIQNEQVSFKTVLEYLVMINEQSYSGIGRQLQITPQQFSDWVKKRRPIPQERSQALANYFGIDKTIFVDNNNFVKPLTPLLKVDIQLLLLDQKVALLEAEGTEDEDIEPYREKKQKLLNERKEQYRLSKFAAVIQLNDERIDHILDHVIHEIESGRIEELEKKLDKGEEQR